MKKLMIAALMLLGTSAAFAGDSDALKAITKAKTYSEAMQLLKANLDQLTNNQEKAKAYDFVTKLALARMDKEVAIQNANLQAQLTKTKEQAYDTLALYKAAYNATVDGLTCMKYDAMPDDKGKVKPKFTKALIPLISNARLQLVQAGNYFAQKNDAAGVLKYWGEFLDTDDNPAFQDSKSQEAQYLGQVALFTAQYAIQEKKFKKADKYLAIAMQDKEVSKQAQTLRFAVAEQNLKNHADSLNYVNMLKEALAKDPSNDMLFGSLCNMYSGLHMDKEMDQALNQRVQDFPNGFTGWAIKGQTLLYRNATAENPNWDECIAALKKANEIDGKNPMVLVYLGSAINAQAAQATDKAAQKGLYETSLGYLNKAKELDPNRDKANWAYPMYQCFYVLYGANDPRTTELEQMLKN